jgi:heptosyltransferase-1
MGDILHALPAVTALRLAHPEWVIDWVAEPRWQALFTAEDSLGRVTSRPLVNRILFAPTKEWRKTPLDAKTHHEIKLLRLALRAGAYDAVLDLQGAIRSAVIGRMAHCPRLIGEDQPRERIARWLFTERVATRGAHVIEQDIELASAVAGDDLKPAMPLLPTAPLAEAWADEILPKGSSLPAVLINPGAGWGAKRWPWERYAAVAKGLVDRGFKVLINAGPGEHTLAEAIVQSRSPAALRFVSPEIPALCTWPARWEGRLWASMAPPTRAATGPTGRDSTCCAAPRAGATTRAMQSRRPVCLPFSRKTCCAPPMNCSQRRRIHDGTGRSRTRSRASGLDHAMAACGAPHSRAAGLCSRGSLSL